LDRYKAQVSNGWTVVSINDDWGHGLLTNGDGPMGCLVGR
jgi:hypothetical protein